MSHLAMERTPATCCGYNSALFIAGIARAYSSARGQVFCFGIAALNHETFTTR